ncbi:MAG: c-type cytochrome [Dokdonella sp.]|uniref:c-type cytochrome n=1 Tax=Dokdonella sp. TaxID=2291710 RepID=UPI003264846E
MIAHRHPRSALLAMLLVIAWLPVGASDLLDLRGIEAIHGDVDAGKTKAAVCMGCHGPVGVSPVPTFPNLAGQHAEYLYWQLMELKREARPESPMTAQVAHLDDAAMRDLAVYFSSLPAAIPTQGTTSSVRGSQLYGEGDASAGIPPCQGCHGRNAEGHPLAQGDAHWRAYPVLRGQHAAYLAQRLKDFQNGKHTLSSNDRIMTPIAQTLDDASITALAAWLESPTR